MIITDEKKIITEIKKNIYNVFYFYGDDSYLIKNHTKYLIDFFDVDIQGFNYNEFSNPEDLKDIIDIIMTLPIFSDKRIVVIKNFSSNNVTADDFFEFLELLDKIPLETKLIISNFSDLVNEKINANDKKVIKKISENGLVCQIKPRSRSSIVKWIMDYTSDFGCSLSKNSAEWVIEQNSFDLSGIMIDVDKLVSYQISGNIPDDIVKKLIPITVETSVYNLTKAINNKDFSLGMKILSDLKLQEVEPIIILNTIITNYSDIFRAKIAINEGFHINNITADFPYKRREFVVKNAMTESRKLTYEKIVDILDNLLESDVLIKSGSIDEFIILESIVSKFMLV